MQEANDASPSERRHSNLLGRRRHHAAVSAYAALPKLFRIGRGQRYKPAE
jgi:hypothetical protein